ncbi:MAG: hypothetical protein K5641_06285 [Lachnospiraceae bacterium]|nr:hypothetical protein [Lachnospiraceae bacterium]
MDSKLKRITIVSAVLCIFLIMGTVFALNIVKQSRITEAQERRAEAEAANAQGAQEQVEKTAPAASADAKVDQTDLTDPSLYAYREDLTFFDQDPTRFEKMQLRIGKKLSLFATSVQRDIRIHVLNDEGELLKGHSLFVKIDDQEYKDLDADGIIYVGDLKAGDYEVKLEEVEGYKVPQNAVRVHVKDNVEYTKIEDISLLIKTEDEIDAAAEDSAKNGAEEDRDKTELTDKRLGEGNTHFGIDVSKWNKEINWDQVAASGVEFAIIRCGYRGSVTGALVEDPYFRKNLEGAKAAGIKVGLYFFTQATDPVEAVEEASMALALVDSSFLEYPIFIDTEGAGGKGRADVMNPAVRTQVCKAFCETIESAGYKAGVYASRNWYNNNLDVKQLDDYVIWLAEYRESPKYEGKYEMWQYTSNGSIEGIDGRVDFDISYTKD